MPSSALIPFLRGLGSLIHPFKQKRAPLLSLGYWEPRGACEGEALSMSSEAPENSVS